jgi:hypothetical protein
MKQITLERLVNLLADQPGPCCSLYQPTHRRHPDNKQDPIRYRNLVEQLERSLSERPEQDGSHAILARFRELENDHEFWNHRTEGLAVLASAGEFEVFELQRPVPERVIVADSFHVKPMLRILQSADRFQLLCLDRHEAKLYEGNRDALDPLELPHVPATLVEALGAETTEPHQTVASYGGTSRAMHHGHGGKSDEVDKDRDRFFRVVDRAILDHHSNPSRLPLMLAALPEYHTHFRNLSKNPFLLDAGIRKHPSGLDAEALLREAWTVMEPLYLARLADLVDRYHAAHARQRGSGDLSDAVRAAVAGRVDTLLVEADRYLPGRIDPTTGAIASEPLDHPEVDDMLDDLAELVLKASGEVVVVPAERMPTDSGLAAIYRF